MDLFFVWQEKKKSYKFHYFLQKLIVFLNLLSVIYDKKFLNRIRRSMSDLRCITSSKMLQVQPFNRRCRIYSGFHFLLAH